MCVSFIFRLYLKLGLLHAYLSLERRIDIKSSNHFIFSAIQSRMTDTVAAEDCPSVSSHKDQSSFDSGHPVQIVTVDPESREFVLDEEALSSILLSSDCKDRAVSVVSIAGDFRKGKSFLLNFLLRYLTNKGYESNQDEWLKDREIPLKGFSWRGGSERDTTGILMWSKPFVLPL